MEYRISWENENFADDMGTLTPFTPSLYHAMENQNYNYARLSHHALRWSC